MNVGLGDRVPFSSVLYFGVFYEAANTLLGRPRSHLHSWPPCLFSPFVIRYRLESCASVSSVLWLPFCPVSLRVGIPQKYLLDSFASGLPGSFQKLEELLGTGKVEGR